MSPQSGPRNSLDIDVTEDNKFEELTFVNGEITEI